MIEFDKFSCHRELVRIQREANFWAPVAFVLTARQYGEVVLPDAASGQSPGTLARNLSRCKEGMAHFLQVMVQIFISITRVAVQFL